MRRSILFGLALGCFLATLPAILQAQPTTGKQKLLAFRQQVAWLQQSPLKDIQWRLIGPNNRSGRCTDVAGVPGDEDVMYAAFATGGLWKTQDGGEHWQPIFDKEGTQSIGSMCLAPSNPNVIYVGTGEANIFRASLPGMGIYKSIDGGNHFEHMGLENTGTVARILVHPDNPNLVYAAASGNEWSYNPDRGVYMSNNGGKSWKKILYVDEKTGCIDLVMDPTDPNTLYASMWNRIRRRWSDPVPEDGDHIYKSVDGGKHWKIIDKGLPDTKFTGRIGIALAHSNPNILYAFVDDHTKKRDPLPGETDSYERHVQKVVIGGSIYRSTDKGESWEKRGEIHDFVKPFSGTYGWVFSQVRVNPKNENELYALGVSMARSADAGKTWTVFRPTDRESDWIHGDNHAMWFDKDNPARIILGNDGGVSSTKDGGKKWTNYFSKIPTTQFYTLTYDMEKPFNVYGAIQDEGTYTGSIANSFGEPQDSTVRAWTYAPGGEGTQIQVDPQNRHIIYSSTYYGRLMKSDLRLADSLRSRRIPTFAVGAIDSLRGAWLAGTLISKFDHQVIYHGLQHLYKSSDAGEHWQIISPDLSYNDKTRMGIYPYLIYHQAITAIAEGDKPGFLYAGTDDGRVWQTLDDGHNWKELSAGLPNNKDVAKIFCSVTNPSRVYVVLNDRRADNHAAYIFVSEDNGTSWKNIAAGLPQAPVNTVFEDDRDPALLFCGTDMGIYYSLDGGTHWITLNGNMPASVPVMEIFVHPRDRKLVAATYGRGVYVLDDINILTR